MVDFQTLDPRDACIVSAVRTPMGAFKGSLSALSATELGGIAIKAALERAGIQGADVDEVYLGNVCSANLGQAPATQAAMLGGVPTSVPCTIVNKVCSSGLKALVFAAQSIRTGDNEVVVAGGMESMSNVPHYVPAMRGGVRLGHAQLLDGLLVDGLIDPHRNLHMGNCGELCAERYSISRAAQDDHAVAAFERAQVAAAAGVSAREVVPVQLPGGRQVVQDEILSKMDAAKLRLLKPAFKPDGGTITAGNASPITDGAAALVLVSGAAARRLHAPVMAVVRGYGDANHDPEWFTTAPASAVPRALARAGLPQEAIDFWEVNQAFSVVDLVNQKLLGLDPERVNVHGGSVALGHPLGASGAVIVARLLNVLRTRGGRRGCAVICNGGGGATAVVIEMVDPDSRI